MKYYIGADLGTSALKLLLVSKKGEVARTVTKEYNVSYPYPGWSEQSPEDWWEALLSGIKELTCDIDKSRICGIGVAGQMHGLVILDEDGNVIRPAILWNDGRTKSQTEYLNNVIGKETLAEQTANIAFAGFTAPKLLWMKENEPENFARISKIMLPKDYINYKLTGVHSCDYSDAAGMLLLDVKNKRWSERMLTLCGVDESQMPTLFESYERIGKLSPEIASLLGLGDNVSVVAGAGDNAAAAVGTGTVSDGKCNISLGTSGTVFICSDSFPEISNRAIHLFCHADGGYHLMGCILSAASCNKWICEDILNTTDYAGEQAKICDDMLGRNSVYFLPYLMGERSPINDTDARGTFIGMHMDTKRADMVQAVLEGVAFAIRDNFEVAREIGINIPRATLCGGGARSQLWRRILCNVLNIPIDMPVSEEGPGMGGAMLAMVGDGEFDSVKACSDAFSRVVGSVLPDKEIAARYDEQYKRFREIYPCVKELFKKLK